MATAQPMFTTDEILWYDNGKWGEVGYAIANPNGKIWTNNRTAAGSPCKACGCTMTCTTSS